MSGLHTGQNYASLGNVDHYGRGSYNLSSVIKSSRDIVDKNLDPFFQQSLRQKLNTHG